MLADYVTLEQGTGAVHTAPGHGADDFLTGKKYGLEIYAPVGPSGHFLETVVLFGGQRVFDANPNVEQALEERGRLWHRETFSHQYPHCWRCHNPVIFLATSQWFVRMDGDPVITGADGQTRTLRDAARHAIDHEVKWIPPWGRDRIFNMVSNRPDWCISRQRAWGVPIPALDCTSCGEAILTTAIIDQAAAVFEQYNADSWYERPIEEFLPAGLTCPSCGGTSFERERDILDVWFDSGSSHEAVLARTPDLGWPSDMYLEGSDQHRGWFQSSLLVALATRGRPPFREVLTHGFLIDLEGRKMSKSVGNIIVPQDVIKESGAEIIRLWVSMTEFTEELRVSKEILTRVVDVYRKLRNTCRILVANLYDFDPATDMVPLDTLDDVDRFALARYAEAAQRMLRAYERVRLLDRLADAEHAGDRRPQRVLRGRDQGSDVHARREVTRAAFDADGHVPDLRWTRASARADPAGDRGRAVAAHSGTRAESVHLEEFPKVDGFTNPQLARDLGVAARRPRNGERGARREAQGQGHRHVARGAGRDHRVGVHRRPPQQPSRRAADALQRLGCLRSDGQRAPGSHEREQDRPHCGGARRGREGAGREVRALLAVRPQRAHRAGLRRHLRPVRRGTGRTGQLLT